MISPYLDMRVESTAHKCIQQELMFKYYVTGQLARLGINFFGVRNFQALHVASGIIFLP